MRGVGRIGLHLAKLVERFTRRFPTIGAGVVATSIYLGLLVRLLLGAVRLGFARITARGPTRASRPLRQGPISRLLLAELRRIEKLGDRGLFNEEIGKSLKWLGHALSAGARLSLAEQFFEAATRYLPRFSEQWIDTMRAVAILRFMQGRMREAMPCFAQVAETKHFLRNRPGVPRNVRILADTWFAALGHVAEMDFLVKKQRLGWEDPDTIFFTARDLGSAPGKTLLLQLEGAGVVLGGKREDLHAWDSLERAAILEDFWETYFPDGEGLPYAYAHAKVQNQWEAENRPPIFQRRDEDDPALQFLRRQLGIPDGAWYVCLHVRQSGFHDGWNRLWEQARDADISTYSEAIRTVTRNGGYVVRMGDPSMPRLAAMERVIDYAHSRFRNEYSDVLLLSGARFCIGTNSGPAVIPGIHGVPCVLTNWVPIGLPNWFAKDLVIPKLLREKGSQKFVTLEEMLSTDLAYVQNPRTLPSGLEFVDNTPEDLVAAVNQMLCELQGDEHDVRDSSLEEAYFTLAVEHGSYRGSRIGTAFMRERGAMLGFHWKGDLRCVQGSVHEPSLV